MARKKENLTSSEHLEEALVPDWEQPYKAPANGCWAYLKPISKLRTGKKDANYGSIDGKYLFLHVLQSQFVVTDIHLTVMLYCSQEILMQKNWSI